jgi:hypothetical protein
LCLDTSALVAVVFDGAPRRTVCDAIEAADTVATSALALPEALAALARTGHDPVLVEHAEDQLRLLWDCLHVVPVDQRCLDEAASLASSQPVTVSAAIHLRAAGRLPGPVRYATFDPGQIPVALSLGFEVVSG